MSMSIQREALEAIIAMDPDGLRADDLGRAVRIARAAQPATPVAPKTLEALTEAADSMYRALEAYMREHHVGRVYTGDMAGHIAALHNALVAYGAAKNNMTLGGQQ